ncbi:MAG: hypothetical protein AAGI90_02065 [Chlamydiota bacterium]
MKVTLNVRSFPFPPMQPIGQWHPLTVVLLILIPIFAFLGTFALSILSERSHALKTRCSYPYARPVFHHSPLRVSSPRRSPLLFSQTQKIGDRGNVESPQYIPSCPLLTVDCTEEDKALVFHLVETLATGYWSLVGLPFKRSALEALPFYVFFEALLAIDDLGSYFAEMDRTVWDKHCWTEFYKGITKRLDTVTESDKDYLPTFCNKHNLDYETILSNIDEKNAVALLNYLADSLKQKNKRPFNYV